MTIDHVDTGEPGSVRLLSASAFGCFRCGMILSYAEARKLETPTCPECDSEHTLIPVELTWVQERDGRGLWVSGHRFVERRPEPEKREAGMPCNHCSGPVRLSRDVAEPIVDAKCTLCARVQQSYSVTRRRDGTEHLEPLAPAKPRFGKRPTFTYPQATEETNR